MNPLRVLPRGVLLLLELDQRRQLVGLLLLQARFQKRRARPGTIADLPIDGERRSQVSQGFCFCF
jgi:hypothetical protein